MTPHELVTLGMKKMAEEFAKAGVSLQMPPPSNLTLGTTYTAIDPGKMLEAQIKFAPQFSNPLSMYQGGFLCAAFDEVYGPLTYMAAERPAVSIELSTSFIRPFTAKDEWMTVKAEVVAKTKTLIVLKAEARTKDKKLIATSTSHSLIVSEQNLSASKGT